ncbi:protein phosphatase 2c and cyclic nucleotide-binding/kinase domain-containing protein [Phtheirospermum japonicum]|uniref:rRNA N-glycosylase n=1 Tax=Phtheirospermum japonicum TaxID=374723 RepID=A0A830BEL3_9LAMI|nr:protein phosphatase 2c and cyclic nucleotide-binding/kinase domain-containing protein [Phtheirospermum japonicum]
MAAPNDTYEIEGVSFWVVLDFVIPNIKTTRDYVALIKRMRCDLGIQIGNMTMVRPVDENDKRTFYGIKFQNDGEDLYVAYRRKDLYLNGFLTVEKKEGEEKETKQWLELKETKEQTENTIPGSKLINMTMDYRDMGSGKTTLGAQDALAKCVTSSIGVKADQLNYRKHEEVARHLMTLVTTTSVALQFNHVTDFMGTLFTEYPYSMSAPSWLRNLVLVWGTLSKLALKYKDAANDSEVKELSKIAAIVVYDLKENKEVVIKTVGDVKSALGMLMYAEVGEDKTEGGTGESSGTKKQMELGAIAVLPELLNQSLDIESSSHIQDYWP